MKNKAFHHRLGFALAGILDTLRSENSFRFQFAAACVVLATLAWLRPPAIWWAIITLTVMLVLAAELLNTAMEHLADHLHPQQHPRIRMVKDCAAGAVLVVSIGALCVAAAFISDFFF